MLLLLIFAVAIGTAKNNARATVVMKDGSVRENVEIQLPKGWDKKLKIKVDNTDNGQLLTELTAFSIVQVSKIL